MSESLESKPGRNGFFGQLRAAAGNASVLISRTAASAHEVLSDAELRRKAGAKLAKGIQGSVQGIGTTADAVRRNVLQNFEESWTSGRRGAQGALERVQAQLQKQRLSRALNHSRNQPVDIQIGFTVYVDVAQEMRSRLWLVLLQDPSLSVPFQELGRFPDLGSYDPDTVTPTSEEALASREPPPQPPHLERFVTQPSTSSAGKSSRSASPGRAGLDRDAVVDSPASNARPEAGAEAGAESRSRGKPLRDSQVPDISDAHSEDHAASSMEASLGPLVKGGEGDEDGAAGAAQGTAAEEGWEVVDKVDPLSDASYVGPASFAKTMSLRITQPDAGEADAGAAAGGPGTSVLRASGPGESADRPQGRLLVDEARRRQEAQEATALKMRVSTDRIKTAMCAVEWPVQAARAEDDKYVVLLQVTLGQEEVEDVIRRDIHRTFPAHPRFLLGQGQQELYNVLKAYSMHDMEVGYCQGMAFVAGILLMYMPEALAFEVFVRLMCADGANLRRYYLDGLEALKLEMAKFEWLLLRHHPRLAAHLQEHCVPCVLYLSQWLLTCFACPFPVDFTAQLVDVMLLERSDRIIMQTAMAIMAECEERLLGLTDFEDIITSLKTEPAQWGDDKLRGLLTAAYLSSVSEAELQLATASMAADSVDKMMNSPAGSKQATVFTADSQPKMATAGDAGAGTQRASAGAAMADGFRTSANALPEGELKNLMETELGALRWAGPQAPAKPAPEAVPEGPVQEAGAGEDAAGQASG